MSYTNSNDVDAEQKPLWKRWGGWTLVALVVIFAKGIGIVVGQATANNFSSGYTEGARLEILPKAMTEAAAEIRKQTPMRVDQITTLVGAMAVGSTITYAMTIDQDFPSSSIAEIKRESEASDLKNTCANEKTRKLIEMGATMVWSYTDQSGDRFEATVNHCEHQ